jgi:hypothetical protein
MASQDQIKFQKQLNDLVKSGKLSVTEYTQIQTDLNRMTEEQVQATRRMVAEMTKALTTAEKRQAVEQKITDLESQQIDLASKIQSGLKGNIKSLMGVHKTSKDITNQYIAQLDNAVKLGTMSKSTAEGLKKQAIESAKLAKNVDRIASSPLGMVFDKAQDAVSRLNLGSEELNNQLSMAVTAGFSAMARSMQQGVGLMGSLRAGMIAFNGAVMANPMLLVGLAIAAAAAALAGLLKLATDHEESARNLAKETGLNIAQTKQMVIESQNVANQLDNQLVASEDILEVQTAMIESMGNVGMLSAEAAADTVEIGIAFGYGAEQAGRMNSTLMSMGVASTDLVDTQREFAADITKSGANVDQVFDDITSNTAVVSKYFSGNTEELKRAAIQANKLGMSIADMAGVAEQLLDFENSLAAQFEFQALTGKNINFDLARQLALQGDIAGATQEVLNQVGSIHEFNNMDFMAKQKLAEATGMSVEQLGKSLALQEKLPGMTEAQAAAAERLGLSQAEIMNMSATELQTRLEQEQAALKMQNEMQKMQQQIGQALLPLAEAFMEVFSALSPILKIIGIVFKGIGAAINGFLAPIRFIFSIFTAIKDAVVDILDNFGFLQPVVSALGMAFTFIKDTLSYAGIILGTIFLPNIIAAAAGAISTAVGFLASAIGVIFNSFGMIPFGIGIPLAIGAVAAMFGMFAKAKSTGDLGIDPNGGPIVASPKVGGLFQGDKRDGLSMGPGFGTEGGAGGGGGGGASVDMTPVVNAIVSMRGILEQIRDKPMTVELDGARVNRQLRSEDSFRKKA